MSEKYKDKSLGYFCRYHRKRVKAVCGEWQEIPKEQPKSFQTIYEEHGEIRMYNKLIIYLRNMFTKGNWVKRNAKAIESLLNIMINNRDLFMRHIDGYQDDRIYQKPNGEFFIK